LQFGYIVVVRGEIGRRAYGVLVKSSMTISSENIKEMLAATTLQSGLCVSIVMFAHTRSIAYGFAHTIHFPSVIRGWLVRRNSGDLNYSKKSHENARSRRRSRVNMPEEKVLYSAYFLNFFGQLVDLVLFLLFYSCNGTFWRLFLLSN